MRALIAPLVLLAAASAFAAEGYKVVHPDGTVEFTDVPHQGAQPIDIPEPQTYTPPPQPVDEPETTPATPAGAAQVKVVYKRVAVITPADDSVVVANDGQLQVSVLTQPPLGAGDKVLLSMDGKVVAEGGGVFILQGVERGTHTLDAKVADSHNRILARSQPIQVHVQHQFVRGGSGPSLPSAR